MTKDEKRYTILKTSWLLAFQLSQLRMPFTIKDAAELYRREIGKISDRTIARHLITFEMLGVVRYANDERRRGQRHLFCWVGMEGLTC